MGTDGDFVVSPHVRSAMDDDFSTEVLDLRNSRWVHLSPGVGRLWYLLTDESATVNEALDILAGERGKPRDELARMFAPTLEHLASIGLLEKVVK